MSEFGPGKPSRTDYEMYGAEIDRGHYPEPDMEECSTTISFGDPPCEHRNGWYRTIPARFFGRRDVFVCTDCGSVLDPETKRKV